MTSQYILLFGFRRIGFIILGLDRTVLFPFVLPLVGLGISSIQVFQYSPANFGSPIFAHFFEAWPRESSCFVCSSLLQSVAWPTIELRQCRVACSKGDRTGVLDFRPARRLLLPNIVQNVGDWKNWGSRSPL